jgi:ferredoxin
VRIAIDPDRCTGHGLCYSVARHLVEPDDRGYGVVVAEEVRHELADEARAAARACPEFAVTISDD